MTINFFATINVTQLAMPLLLASRAHVVNIASLAGKSPWPFLGPYGASKAALVAYTHQLRVELRDRLQVLLVCPGPIAREDAGTRYLDAKHTLPQQAHLPGGGARIRGILPEVLATKIIRAIASGRAELVLPWHARLVFAIAQLSPRWGDWILRNFGGGKDIPALPVE
jgi:short-subunit dehydrogenase